MIWCAGASLPAARTMRRKRHRKISRALDPRRDACYLPRIPVTQPMPGEEFNGDA